MNILSVAAAKWYLAETAILKCILQGLGKIVKDFIRKIG